MAIIPIIVGLVGAGALAFGLGGKQPKAAAQKPATHRPKKRPPSVEPATEAAIIAAMNSPQAMQALIAATKATGDASRLWNLGRTILVNSQGKPSLQAAAMQVLANAVVMAVQKGTLGDLVATALSNGDGAILSRAAQQAAQLNPSMQGVLGNLIKQLAAAAAPPQSPGQPRPPLTTDEKSDTHAAQAAATVLADAVNKATQIANQPASAPMPSDHITTLPEIVITPGGESQVMSPAATVAMNLTDYLATTSRYHEDKSKVGQAQAKLGLNADGKYGPGTAKKVASLGVVPVPPFYWTKGKAPAQKTDYKAYIASMAGKFPDQNWSPALAGVDKS